MPGKYIDPEESERKSREDPGATLRLHWAVVYHHMDAVEAALRKGADVDSFYRNTGLTALHIAVGQNDLPMCQFLVEAAGASFFADGYGRWPSLVAAECRVDEELSDFICEAEMAFLQKKFGS